MSASDGWHGFSGMHGQRCRSSSSSNSPSQDADLVQLRSMAQQEPLVWNVLEDDVSKMLVSRIPRDLG